jgi:hypothetical protein
MLDFFRSRKWVVRRRLFLLAAVIIVAIRQYGGNFTNFLQRPDPVRDIVVTRAEFRAGLPGSKPAWIINFRNNSTKFTYDEIELEAEYFDGAGNMIGKDTLKVRQKLPPDNEKLVGSVDYKDRGAARSGTLRVIGAQEVQ